MVVGGEKGRVGSVHCHQDQVKVVMETHLWLASCPRLLWVASPRDPRQMT